jgi:excisionase family DNA binding protein
MASNRQIPRLLTAKEVAGRLMISVKTVYSLTKRQLIPYVKIESSVRFPEEELISWLEEHAFHPRPLPYSGRFKS